MEQVYLKGYPRNWHSGKEDLKVYFTAYSHRLNTLKRYKNMSVNNILKSVLPDNLTITKSELKELISITNTKQLKQITPEVRDENLLKSIPKGLANAIKWKTTPHRKTGNFVFRTCNPDTQKQTEEFHETHTLSKEEIERLHELTDDKKNLNLQPLSVDLPLNLLNMQAVQTDVKYKHSAFNTRQKLLMGETTNGKKINVVYRMNNYVVSFRVHEPFRHDEDSKTEQFLQEILLLSNQSLSVLRDKIICQSDFQDVQGDVSENPDSSTSRMSRDVYKSAMFYIDNTFYIDNRYEENVDYSSVLKQWARSRGIPVGRTVDMNHVFVRNLKMRFGYPYLYMHQGSCEHLVIITDARMLNNSKDPQNLDQYPYMTRIPRRHTNCCIICMSNIVRWIVADNDRLLHDVSFMCDICFRSFNYIKGKKVGRFKAYHYFQKSVLL